MQAARSVQVTFEVTRAPETYDGTTAHTAHMQATARLIGGWAGIRVGFVQHILNSERIYVYKSEDLARTVTVTRDLPAQTLDGLSGDSPHDLFYSRSGFSETGGNLAVDDTPANDPPKMVMHDGAQVPCFLHSVTMRESFHLRLVSYEGGQFQLWWEGTWGYDLTTLIAITLEQGKKAVLRKYSRRSFSGSVSKSMGQVLLVPRQVAVAGGRFATSYGGERDRKVDS